MYSFWQTIAHTPWWVFVVLIYLIWVGFLASKPRSVSIQMLMMGPVILMILSFIGLYSIASWNLAYSSIWIAATGLGTLLGWVQFSLLKIKAIHGTNKIAIPGSWGLLILILIIFSVKYYFGYEFAVDPDKMKEPKYVTLIVAVYGFITGIFLGRYLYALKCLKKGPYQNVP